MTERLSPFQSVYGNIEQRKNDGTLQVPVFELSPVMPRTDNMGIFDEGEQFSGVMETDNAKACVTIVASAHVPPTVPTAEFLDSAKAVFGDETRLPENADGVEVLPPQTIVWWARNSEQDGERSDFLEMSKMDTQTQSELRTLISTQTHKAAQFIDRLKGSGVIWGSWGNGNMTERQASGMSRGVPTNKIGHSHVIHIDEARQILKPQERQTSIRDEVNFANPWTSVIHERFGDEIGAVLESSIRNRTQEDTPDVTVTRQSPDAPDELSRAGHYEGFDIRFAQTATYAQAVDTMVAVAGTLEDVYQNIVARHAEHYLQSGNAQAQTEVHATLVMELIAQGFSSEKAEEMAEFSLALKPTFTQLEGWQKSENPALGDLHTRYSRVSGRLRNGQETYFKEIVADTYRPAADVGQIERTFPVHASGWYLFEDYEVTDEAILVDGFKVFPAISSSIGGPERILGGIEKRPLMT